MSLEELKNEIESFINQYDGTAIGQSIFNKLSNTEDNDYDRLYDIYNEITDIK